MGKKVTPVEGEVPVEGPLAAKRGCRDLICLLFFIVFMIGWVIVFILAATDGCPDDCNTPMRLVYGYDSSGNMCSGSKKQMFIGVPVDLTNSRVCVDGCPKENGQLICVDANGALTATPTNMANVELCMLSGNRKSCCYVSYKTKEVLFKCIPDVNANSTRDSSGNSTNAALWSAVGSSDSLSGAKSFAANPMGKIGSSFSTVMVYKLIIGLSVVVAFLIGFVWLIIVRLLVKPMVAITLIGLMVFLIGVTVLFLAKGGIIGVGTTVDAAAVADTGVAMSESDAKIVAYILCAITGVYLILMIVFFKRLMIACNILTEAGKAVGAIPTTTIYPFFTVCGFVIVAVWFIATSLYLASAGEFDPKTMTFKYTDSACETALTDAGASSAYAKQSCSTHKGDKAAALAEYNAAKERYGASYTGNVSSSNLVSGYANAFGVTLNAQTYDYFLAYNLFGFLWSYAFIGGVAYLTLAGAFATWYWTMDKKKLPHAPLLRSFVRTFRYHLGSVAFGSFILAVVQMIRIVFNYIVRKMDKHKDNKLVKLLVCCVNCMLKCLERFIDFINKNAYIMIAIHGYSFCKGAKEAFGLIIRNALQIMAVSILGDAILFLGRLVVCFGTVFVAYAYFNAVSNDPTLIPEAMRPKDTSTIDTFPVMPMIAILLIGYMIGTMFMGVYETAIDTIFLSFCEDREKNDGSVEKPYYMAPSLRNALNVKNKVAPSD